MHTVILGVRVLSRMKTVNCENSEFYLILKNMVYDVINWFWMFGRYKATYQAHNVNHNLGSNIVLYCYILHTLDLSICDLKINRKLPLLHPLWPHLQVRLQSNSIYLKSIFSSFFFCNFDLDLRHRSKSVLSLHVTISKLICNPIKLCSILLNIR